MIVCGFPGVGKTYLTKLAEDEEKELGNSAWRICDTDLSEVYWTKDDNGENTEIRNHNYIKDYVDMLEKCSHNNIDIIFASIHYKVLEELNNRNISFHVLTPLIKDKDLYMKRYKDRGSSNSFIEMMDTHFEFMIDWCRTPMKNKRIIIAPKKPDSNFIKVLYNEINNLNK